MVSPWSKHFMAVFSVRQGKPSRLSDFWLVFWPANGTRSLVFGPLVLSPSLSLTRSLWFSCEWTISQAVGRHSFNAFLECHMIGDLVMGYAVDSARLLVTITEPSRRRRVMTLTSLTEVMATWGQYYGSGGMGLEVWEQTAVFTLWNIRAIPKHGWRPFTSQVSWNSVAEPLLSSFLPPSPIRRITLDNFLTLSRLLPADEKSISDTFISPWLWL